MLKKWFKILLSIGLGGLFLWLAFRNVNFHDLGRHLDHITYWWILPFILVTLFSHYCRAERWRLLIEEEDVKPNRMTLYAGVMFGYLLNLIFPRLGEVSRPMYVAKRENLSSSNLIGTIILERVIDLLSMGILMFIVAVYVIADTNLLRQIFGNATVSFFQNIFQVSHILYLIGGLAGLGILGYLIIKLVGLLGNRYEIVAKFIDKIQQFNRMFVDGLLAIRKVKNWGAFIGFTVLIWFNYILMTYIPFWMFHMQSTYDLGLLEALTVTVISAVGIAIPTPGGIGTYHYFVKQALLILFAVPAVTGLAYATVTHATMSLIIIIFTPIFMLIDKFKGANPSKNPQTVENLAEIKDGEIE